MTTPNWWTPTDTATIDRYRAWMAEGERLTAADCGGEDLDNPTPFTPAWDSHFDRVNFSQWTCRVCAYWLSHNGVSGKCEGPELRCGRVPSDGMCEQWSPRSMAEEAVLQEFMDL